MSPDADREPPPPPIGANPSTSHWPVAGAWSLNLPDGQAVRMTTADRRRLAMKVILSPQAAPVSADDCLIYDRIPRPIPGPGDLLVRIEAISVNPLDARLRGARHRGLDPLVLGWEAAGIVVDLGADVREFSHGDAVFFLGQLDRPGCYAEYGLIDARLAAKKPSTLDFEQTAALPLAAITAWEALFEHLTIPISKTETVAGTLLIIGAAGGVGSVAIQLARRLTSLDVIAGASRPASQAWCRDLGAHHVIDHSKPWGAQLQRLGAGEPDYILCLRNTDGHWHSMVEALAPFGRIALTEETDGPLYLGGLHTKSGAIGFALPFTRSLFQTGDMERHRWVLDRVAALYDGGRMHPIQSLSLGPMTPDSLRAAHRRLETGQTIGKIALGPLR